jgi:hypothetical protein
MEYRAGYYREEIIPCTESVGNDTYRTGASDVNKQRENP